MSDTKPELTMVRFYCSVCAHKLAVWKRIDSSFDLLAKGWNDEWLRVATCPQCQLEYPQESLIWRYEYGRLHNVSEIDL